MVSRRTFIKGSLLSASALALPGFVKWETKSPLPYNVQEIYPALHQGKIYVAGGLSLQGDNLKVLEQVVEYNPESDKWNQSTTLPEPRHHPYLISHQNKLYAFSGFTESKRGSWFGSRDILLLDEKTKRWKKHANHMQHPLCETVAASINGCIHLASGRKPKGESNGKWGDHTDTDAHLIFDPATMTWNSAQPIPTARNSAAGACIDGMWHVIGGRTVNGGNLDTHEVYDYKTDQWSALAPLPQAQGGLAAATLNEHIYVFGGEYFTSGGGVYKKVWQYSRKDDKWQQVGEMPVPRHGLGAVTLEGSIYVVAGATQAGGNGTSDRLSVFKL
ncbi:Kelch repeat-containing protein [Kangiella sediminilitoris]|uniref:Kelch repeat-containing protein n=1 Tax=Kangiella sediminilitoris TaxID=1144748 RepID=A0A1B3BAQ2_9GAMM|nr:kelch repeat-containing protein [Kangiella sediminilitoris]AOE49846.1 Kelch repeat-containing protein [Kangiella sediminilitoris]